VLNPLRLRFGHFFAKAIRRTSIRRRVESLIRERSTSKALFDKMGIIHPAVPVFARRTVFGTSENP
jgi:hypothetical protein